MTDSNIEFYPDVIAAFSDGCVMDLRVRLAVDFIKAMISSDTQGSFSIDQMANTGLSLAGSLIAQAKASGLIAPLPESGELNAQTKRHLERAVNAQMYQQKYAQRQQQDELRLAGGMTLNG